MDVQTPDLAFLPLGGTGEIGMNLNLYRSAGKWLAVDCGMGFGGAENPEVDIMVPDPSFIAERRDKLDALRACRMVHGEAPRVQSDARVGQRLGSAVTQIAQQRRHERATREPQLMRAPGQRFEFEDAGCTGIGPRAARGREHAPAGRRLAGARGPRRHHGHMVARLVLQEPLHELPPLPICCLARRERDEADVGLPRHVLAERRGEPCRAFARAREHDDPRHRTVEAMHDAEEHIAWLLKLVPHPFARTIEEALVTALVRDDGQARWLHHSEDMVVDLEDLERHASAPERAGAAAGSASNTRPRHQRAQKPAGRKRLGRPGRSSSRSASSPASTVPPDSSLSTFVNASGE